MLGSIIGTALSVVANSIGSAIANKRKREAEAAYRADINEEIGDINKEIESNYLDRADAQDALRKMTNANTESMRQLNTEAIRGGATEEAKVAMASALNKNTADMVGSLAAAGEQHKDRLKEQKRSLKTALRNQKYATDGDVSGVETLTNSFASAASSLGKAWDGRKDMPVTPNVETIDTSASAAKVEDVMTAPPQIKYGELIKTW